MQVRPAEENEVNTETILDGIKITTGILVINVTLLDLLGQFPLALPRFLGTLELQTVLVHGESHCLGRVCQEKKQRCSRGGGGQTLTLSS